MGFNSKVGKTITGENGKQTVEKVDEKDLPESDGTISSVSTTTEKLYKIQIGAFKKKIK
jgi:hypothetical protein